jgi:hypothetical protein
MTKALRRIVGGLICWLRGKHEVDQTCNQFHLPTRSVFTCARCGRFVTEDRH